MFFLIQKLDFSVIYGFILLITKLMYKKDFKVIPGITVCWGFFRPVPYNCPLKITWGTQLLCIKLLQSNSNGLNSSIVT